MIGLWFCYNHEPMTCIHWRLHSEEYSPEGKINILYGFSIKNISFKTFNSVNFFFKNHKKAIKQKGYIFVYIVMQSSYH